MVVRTKNGLYVNMDKLLGIRVKNNKNFTFAVLGRRNTVEDLYVCFADGLAESEANILAKNIAEAWGRNIPYMEVK